MLLWTIVINIDYLIIRYIGIYYIIVSNITYTFLHTKLNN